MGPMAASARRKIRVFADLEAPVFLIDGGLLVVALATADQLDRLPVGLVCRRIKTLQGDGMAVGAIQVAVNGLREQFARQLGTRLVVVAIRTGSRSGVLRPDRRVELGSKERQQNASQSCPFH